MKQTSSKNHSVDQSNPVYHDTYRLLKSYRDAVWNLELEVQHVKREFEIEYESSIDDFLESIYLAGADLNGSKLENYAKSIERSNQMLSLLNSAVEILRNKHKFGEQYYWILYYTYLSPQQLQNADEILVLEQGAAAERGTHNSLMAQNGIYASMWRDYQTSVAWNIGKEGHYAS